MTVHDKFHRPFCPHCDSSAILKNGSTHHKKQKYLCKDCRYQFIGKPSKQFISSTE